MSLGIALISAASHGDTLSDLQQCATTKDSLVRLVCYDKVMKQLNGGVTVTKKSEPVAVRPTQPIVSNAPTPLRPTTNKAVVVQQPQSKEDSFGQEHIQRAESQDISDTDEINVTVASVKRGPRDNLIITLQNGPIWRQSDGEYMKLSSGDEVKLSKGILGAIYLNKTGQNKKIRVKRKK